MKQIMITGGCGFIGSALVRRLNAEQIIPHVIDCTPPPRSMRDLKFSYKNIDLRKQSNALQRLCQMRHLTVVHLAAEHFIPRCEQNPRGCFETNVYGTYHLVTTLAENRTAKLIFASTGDVYPSSETNLTESSALQPGGVYNETKRIGEGIVRDGFLARHKIFRMFNVYGPGDETPHLIPSIIRQLRQGNRVRLGNLRTVRDYIFIDDVVTVIAKEIASARPESIYNVGTGIGLSVKQVIDTFEMLLGRSIELRSVRSLRRSFDKLRLVTDPAQIRRDYGIAHPTSFARGLALLIQYTKL